MDVGKNKEPSEEGIEEGSGRWWAVPGKKQGLPMEVGGSAFGLCGGGKKREKGTRSHKTVGGFIMGEICLGHNSISSNS